MLTLYWPLGGMITWEVVKWSAEAKARQAERSTKLVITASCQDGHHHSLYLPHGENSIHRAGVIGLSWKAHKWETWG